jgi:hypothetical protein
MGNTQKSFLGAPTVNLYDDGDFSSGTLHPVRSGTWSIVADPRNPTKNVLKVLPSSGNQYHGRDIPAVVSTLYSMRVDVYASPDCNLTDFRLYGEDGAGGVSISYNFLEKGTWQSFIFNGKSATSTNLRVLMYALAAFTTGFVLVSNIQVEVGSFATPFVNGTRSNTQSIVDLTGNNVITANSLTYASDNTFSFNGGPVPISLGTQLIGSGNNITVDTMFKSSNIGTSNFSLLLGWGVGDSNSANLGIGNYFGRYSDESIFFGLNSAVVVGSYRGGHSLYHDGNYHHAVFVLSPNNYKIFVDGQDLPLSYSHGSSAVNVGDIFSFGQSNIETRIGNRPAVNGDGPFNGEIPYMKIYNRALTAAEVQQNFNATRSRYGI